MSKYRYPLSINRSSQKALDEISEKEGETFATTIRRMINIGVKVWHATRNPDSQLYLEERVVDEKTGEEYMIKTIILIP